MEIILSNTKYVSTYPVFRVSRKHGYANLGPIDTYFVLVVPIFRDD